MKKLIITILLLSLTGCGSVNFGGDSLMEWEKPGKEYLKIKAPKEKILHSKNATECASYYIENIGSTSTMEELSDFNFRGDCKEFREVKSYLYVSDKKIKKEQKEIDGEMVDEHKRTKNAIIYKKPELFGGSEIAPQEYVGMFYAGEPFYQDGEDWYQTETATTTIEAYEEQTATTTTELILSWIVKKVLAGSGDPIYTGAGDGGILHGSYPTASSWTIARNSPTYFATNSTAANYYAGGAHKDSNQHWAACGFFPTDTSEIGIDSTVTSATLNLWVPFLKNNGANQEYGYTVVVETFQNSTATLQNDDYLDCGSDNGTAGRALEASIEQGSDQIDYDVASIEVYSVFTLNATGLGWISKDGTTKIGTREGHDLFDVTPGTTNSTGSMMQSNMSEQTGTSQDPYLEVVYSGGGGFTPVSEESDWIFFN